MDKTEQLAHLLRESKNLCVFTGAGISCPSGIPDFRSANGLYRQRGEGRYAPEEIISHSFFLREPALFYEFYRSKMVYPDAKPNEAHRFFAALETPGRVVSVVTQNIDGLHQAAGSSRVFELHGSVHRNFCTRCHAPYDLREILRQDGVPHCPRDGAILKPDVVLYEEPLDETVVENAVNAIRQADVMVVVGTSLSVYPAASYLRDFRGRALVLINRDATPYDNRADLVFNDDIIRVVTQLKQSSLL